VKTFFESTPSRNGTGTFVWYTSFDIYEGGWLNDKRHGRGRLRYGPNNKQHRLEYEGEWREDVIEGRGRMTWTDGNVYDGEWQNDQRHGEGRLTRVDGGMEEGSWRQDQLLVGKESSSPPS